MTNKTLEVIEKDIDKAWQSEAMQLLIKLERELYMQGDYRYKVLESAIELLDLTDVGNTIFVPSLNNNNIYNLK